MKAPSPGSGRGAERHPERGGKGGLLGGVRGDSFSAGRSRVRREWKGRSALLAVRGVLVPSERMLTTTGSHVRLCSERHFGPSPLRLPSRALNCNEFNAGQNNTEAGQVPLASRPLCPLESWSTLGHRPVPCFPSSAAGQKDQHEASES